MIIRHMLATALTEALPGGNVAAHCRRHVHPAQGSLLPFLLISVVAVFMLLATVITLVMALSCFRQAQIALRV
jgi:hypothetical protein